MENTAVLLVDHSSLKTEGLSPRAIITSLLDSFSTAWPQGSLAVQMHVRAYGGWFIEQTTSPDRFEAAAYYQSEVPSIIRIGGRLCQLSFEFADYLVRDGNPTIAETRKTRITNTVVARSTPQSYKVKQDHPRCQRPDCTLRLVRKWLRTGRACPAAGCSFNFDDFFERTEQKQVDVHIAVDLLQLAGERSQYDHLALASDDMDFVPALIAAKRAMTKQSRTVTLIRTKKPNAYLVSAAASEGIRLLMLS